MLTDTLCACCFDLWMITRSSGHALVQGGLDVCVKGAVIDVNREENCFESKCAACKRATKVVSIAMINDGSQSEDN